MTEKFINPEGERIPSEREVLKIIESHIVNNLEGRPYTEKVRLEDPESGLYKLVLEIIGEDGCPIAYSYVRAGNFYDSTSSETAIDIINIDNKGRWSGECLAKYEGGTWKIH